MYICVNRSGKNNKNAYVKLMEAYVNEDGKKRARVIKNFGRLDDLLADDPLALEKLKKKYRDESAAKKQAIAEERRREVARILEKAAEPASARRPDVPNQALHYGHYAVRRLWDKERGLASC